MNDTTRQRLRAIMARHQEAVDREQDRIDQAHVAEVLFVQQWAALMENVIRPAFADLEVELTAQGHRCQMIEPEAAMQPGADDEAMTMGCAFYPKGWDEDGEAAISGPAQLTVSCDRASHRIKITESTFGPLANGWSGEVGCYEPQDLSVDLIAAAFVAMVEKIILDPSFIANSLVDPDLTWIGPGRRAEQEAQTLLLSAFGAERKVS